MTEQEIIALAEEEGRAEWGKPLPPRAVQLLRLYAQQEAETMSQLAS